MPRPPDPGLARPAVPPADAGALVDTTLARRILTSPSDAGAARLLKRASDETRAALVEELAQAVLKLLRIDARRALAVAERQALAAAGHPLLEARAVWSRAHALTNLARQDEAAEHYARAATLFRRLGQPLLAARTALGHVDALMYLGRYDQAMKIGKAARKILRRHGDLRQVIGLDSNLANILHRTDRPARALRAYDQALRAARRLADAERIRGIQFNRANVLTSLGRYPEAEALYRQVREEAEDAGETGLVAWVDYSIGFLMLQRSDYSSAYATLDDARVAFEMLGDTHRLAHCHLDLAELLLEINRFERAEHQARRARLLYDQLGLRYESGKATLFLAIAALGQNENRQAEELLREGAAIFREEANPASEAVCELYGAEIDRRNGRAERAAVRLAHAERSFASGGLRIRQIVAALRRARLAIRLRRAALANGHLARAQVLLRRRRAPWLWAQYEHLMGHVALLGGEPTKALRHLRRAVEGIEEIRGRIGLDEFRLSFAADKAPIYADLVELTLRTRRGNQSIREAFDFVERARSRALVDLLAGRLRGVEDRLDRRGQVMLKRLEELRGEINWLSGGEAPGRGQRDESRLARSGSQLRAREAEIADIMQRLARRDRRLGALTVGETITLEEVQSRLPEGTKLIEYFLTDARARAFVIDRRRARVVDLAATPREIEHELDRLRFQIEKWGYGDGYVRGRERLLFDAAREHLGRLADQVWHPLEIEDFERLWIVPHGPLHSLPFHALPLDRIAGGGSYLADQAEITCLPSASILNYTPVSANGGDSMLVVSVEDHRIPKVREEVERVVELFPGARILRDEQATLGAVAAAAREADYLHLAAHGIFRPDDPYFSALRLADGWLSLYDIYRLRLKARLVSLSACQSGRSWVGGGDEIVGLVRGFLHAGASSLVVSLWPVHDSTTADLMSAFYREVKKGERPSAALRSAMLEVREEHPHPYHWAPFVHVGTGA